MNQKYKPAVDILNDIWIGIDWENIDKNRLRTIWSEFEGQVRGLSKSHSSLSEFVNKLCKRFKSSTSMQSTIDALNTDHSTILNLYRYDTQVVILYLKLLRGEVKQNYEYKKLKNQNG
jgi:hypothetical protein